jgi:hypothetical protein
MLSTPSKAKYKGDFMTCSFASPEWLEQHLRDWAKRYSPKRDTESVVQAVIKFADAHPEVLERGDAWSQIYELSQRKL